MVTPRKNISGVRSHIYDNDSIIMSSFLYNIIFLLFSCITSLKIKLFTKSFTQKFRKTSYLAKGYDFDFEYDSNKSNKLNPSENREIHNLVENLIADMVKLKLTHLSLINHSSLCIFRN